MYPDLLRFCLKKMGEKAIKKYIALSLLNIGGRGRKVGVEGEVSESRRQYSELDLALCLQHLYLYANSPAARNFSFVLISTFSVH